MLFLLKKNQKMIITLGCRNIRINSLAGAGKSSFCYSIADQFFKDTGKSTLILTFSSLLKVRGREDVKDKPYILVHSFHSSICSLYKYECYKSDHFSFFLKSFIPCAMSLSLFGLLCLDEVQDLNEDLFAYVSKLRFDLPEDHKMLIVGDRFQNVFSSLQNSSPKYIESPELYFQQPFVSHYLNETYRVPPKISTFINKYINPNAIKLHYPDLWNIHISQMWGEGLKSHISTHIHQDEVGFYRFPFYKQSIPHEVVQNVKHFISTYGPDSVLVVVRSCKFSPKHPIGQLITQCPETSWIVLTNDIGENATILKNKSIVGTPWKLKGCQSKYVLFCGLDSSLERDDAMLAFSLAYVGLSRPLMHLDILSNSTHELFFTMREQKTSINNTQLFTYKVSDFVTYNSFDMTWDVLETSVLKTLEPYEMDVQIHGKKGFEPIKIIYEHALRKGLVHSLIDDSEIDWVKFVTNAINETFELSYMKRQLPEPSTWVNHLMLDIILERCFDLIPDSTELQPEKPLFLSNKLKNITGTIHLFLDNHKLINVYFTKEFEYTQGQEVLLLGEMITISEKRKPNEIEMYVLNPLIGELRQINVKPGLFEAMLKRKQII
jgi:hypothetical protein